MLNPPHPGETIRELCLEPLGLTETAAAEGLGVSHDVLGDLLEGRTAITPEMALRLAMGFGGSAESWLQQQMQYDLAQARRRLPDLHVPRFAVHV